MLYELFIWCVLVLLVLCPLLWRVSEHFRYQVKVLGLYAAAFLTPFISFPYILLHPYDPNNHGVVFRIFQHITWWASIEWRVIDFHHLDFDGPCVVMANHQSSVDLQERAVLTMLTTSFHYYMPGMGDVWPDRGVCMIKKSLSYAGLFGIAAHMSHAVFIDRFNSKDARSTLDASMEKVKNMKLKLFVFPEGTRNHEDGLLPFKKGGFHLAVQAQIPIVPVVFSSYKPFYSRKERRWTPDGVALIKVLPPIPTVGLSTSDDVSKLTDQTRELMLKTFNEISIDAARLCAERKKDQ